MSSLVAIAWVARDINENFSHFQARSKTAKGTANRTLVMLIAPRSLCLGEVGPWREVTPNRTHRWAVGHVSKW